MVQGASSEFVRIALEHGANPDATNRDQEPLIHIARRAGNWDSIAALLDAGAQSDKPAFGVPGSTLLVQVTGRGDFDKAYWLMERGADPGIERSTATGLRGVNASRCWTRFSIGPWMSRPTRKPPAGR